MNENELKVSMEVTEDGKSVVVIVTSQEGELSHLDVYKALNDLGATILMLAKENNVKN